MRWNCPHCGINLAVSDEKLGAGWSFSRCYKCAGFALIRRADVNLVKVDRAPAGEQIILPEASEDPTALLSEEALQNLNRLRRDSAEKAAARATMNQAQEAIQQALSDQDQSFLPNPPQNTSRSNSTTASRSMPLPDALPDPQSVTVKKASRRFRLLSWAISAAGVMTIGSGAYLYFQGQALWEKAQIQVANDVVSRSNEATPVMQLTAHSKPEASDQISHSAMAPVRPNAPAESEAPSSSASLTKGSASLIVQPRAKNADLHSGPGSLYPIVGIANTAQHYLVTDWNDRWFRVILRENAAKEASKPPKMAWIRTDLVQVVPAGSDSLPPYP